MQYVIGILFAISAIILIAWAVLYVVYIAALWLTSFIDSYQILFYGFSGLLFLFGFVWISKATGIDRDHQIKKQAYELLSGSLANIKDTLSKNWKK